jgi:hypothetical protein
VTVKTEIMERLGEKAVPLPSLIGEALAANDRIKLRLSLLQEAAPQEQMPKQDARRFAAEQRAVGIEEPALDALVAGAHTVGRTRLFLPGVGSLLAGVAGDLAAMLTPLEAADADSVCSSVTVQAACGAESSRQASVKQAAASCGQSNSEWGDNIAPSPRTSPGQRGRDENLCSSILARGRASAQGGFI